MSNQFNQAGQSLIIDEIIELKGSKKDTVTAFKQQLDAQLFKRDTSMIQAQIALIGADDIISPSEKTSLKKEYNIIVSNHSVIVSKAEEYGITEQTLYNEYLAAFNSLKAFLLDLFTSMDTATEIVSHEELMGLFQEYYDKSSLLEEQFFRFTTGLLGGLDNRIKFEVTISSTKGVTVPIDNTPTTLSVMLLREGEDVTDDYTADCFTWERVSEDRVADSLWRDGMVSGKTLSVSIEDLVYRSASFMCRFHYPYSETMYFNKTGFITLSEEVQGPKGEDAYQTQVISHGGTVFRMGENFSTTMEVKVWQGGEEITDLFSDEDFRWRRTSNDSYQDGLWNSAHYSTGGKVITITQDDVVGRSNFFCDLLTKRS
jgi:hypothetical protein